MGIMRNDNWTNVPMIIYGEIHKCCTYIGVQNDNYRFVENCGYKTTYFDLPREDYRNNADNVTTENYNSCYMRLDQFMSTINEMTSTRNGQHKPYHHPNPSWNHVPMIIYGKIYEKVSYMTETADSYVFNIFERDRNFNTKITQIIIPFKDYADNTCNITCENYDTVVMRLDQFMSVGIIEKLMNGFDNRIYPYIMKQRIQLDDIDRAFEEIMRSNEEAEEEKKTIDNAKKAVSNPTDAMDNNDESLSVDDITKILNNLGFKVISVCSSEDPDDDEETDVCDNCTCKDNCECAYYGNYKPCPTKQSAESKQPAVDVEDLLSRYFGVDLC